jgi:hypothetical protein
MEEFMAKKETSTKTKAAIGVGLASATFAVLAALYAKDPNKFDEKVDRAKAKIKNLFNKEDSK